MDLVVQICLVAVLAIVAWRLLQRRDKRPEGSSEAREEASESAPPPEGAGGSDGSGESDIHLLAQRVVPAIEAAAQPTDLLHDPAFALPVVELAGSPMSNDELLSYYKGTSAAHAWLALCALARRDVEEALLHEVLRSMSGFSPWTRFFALRLLEASVPADRPLVGPVLLATDATWTSVPALDFLRDFVKRRVAAGERLAFPEGAIPVDGEELQELQELLAKLEDVEPLVEALASWKGARIDHELLSRIGSVHGEDDFARAAASIPHPALDRIVDALVAGLLRPRPRSAVVVGAPGVGKSTAVDGAAARLAQAGWVVFEAGHTELIAGQSYQGQLEARLRELIRNVEGERKVVWVIRELDQLRFTGTHEFQRVSAIARLLPLIAEGRIRVLGEALPGPFEALARIHPRVRGVLDVHVLDPLDEAGTLAVARRWCRDHDLDAEDAVLEEGWQLLAQVDGEVEAPGNLIQLLDHTVERLTATGAARTLRVDHLLDTLAELTGLPADILNSRARLDLDEVRAFFTARVLGQPEAVRCLVDRIAMIKAGVTDPSRPLGVFLFAGPTGTGKTEIAKALAAWLFGSPDRMIRLDMSEFQAPDSLGAIVGASGAASETALVDRVRQHPFSVVLLDEFEKAHPQVWDLFLQTFDDGRLTDRQGRTADFRHTIVVMTTNLGASVPTGKGVGFTAGAARFRPETAPEGRAALSLGPEPACARRVRKWRSGRLDRVLDGEFDAVP